MAFLSDEYQEKFLALQLEIAENEREIRRKSFELQQETMTKFLELVTQKMGRLGLISQGDLATELNISHPTILRWEKAGLKRYLPPLEDTRTVFYKVLDILKFLEADND